MLDALQAIGLLGLIACQFVLIRGCFKINESLPIQGGAITSKIDRTADLLDEVAQLISDFSDNLSGNGNTPPPPSPMEAILTAFMSKTTMGGHGTKESEWEVLPPNNDPTTQEQTENESHQPRS
jgi:hypothetical protein